MRRRLSPSLYYAPPGHRGGGNGGPTATPWPSFGGSADSGAFRRQLNAPNGGVRPQAKFAQRGHARRTAGPPRR